MFVCICKGITESRVQAAAAQAGVNPDAIAQALGLHDNECCGRCARDMGRIMSYVGRMPAGAGA
ncbi:MAG: hypothetical protein FJ318_05010 [SAR202 cluster bacterium]|nr:hypothetical protein [SAR202 cluster bacterium]